MQAAHFNTTIRKKHERRAKLQVSKQVIGFELWGKVHSTSNRWGDSRCNMPTKCIPLSPAQWNGSLLTKGTMVCRRREIVRILFSICLCYRHPHDFVLMYSPLCNFLFCLNWMLMGQDLSKIQAHELSSAQHTSHCRDSLSGATITGRRVNTSCNTLVLWDLSLSDTDTKADLKNWKPHKLLSW